MKQDYMKLDNCEAVCGSCISLIVWWM